MAIPQDNLLEEIKLDIAARLSADHFFSDIHVVYEQEDDINTARENALVGRVSKNGKKGAAVIIHAIDIIEATGQAAMPQMKVQAVIECAETRKLNQSSVGTGKTAAEISARVVQLLHHYTPHHLCMSSWHMPSNPIQELTCLKGMAGFAVMMDNYAYFKSSPKVISPRATGSGTELVITPSTPDSEIWYSTAGTYPSEENGAQLYTAPITVSPGDVISFIGRLDGYDDSDVLQAKIN